MTRVVFGPSGRISLAQGTGMRLGVAGSSELRLGESGAVPVRHYGLSMAQIVELSQGIGNNVTLEGTSRTAYPVSTSRPFYSHSNGKLIYVVKSEISSQTAIMKTSLRTGSRWMLPRYTTDLISSSR